MQAAELPATHNAIDAQAPAAACAPRCAALCPEQGRPSVAVPTPSRSVQSMHTTALRTLLGEQERNRH